MSNRSILKDVALAYLQANERYEQATRRGDFDRADDALSDMQTIERCVSVNETSTAWRHRRRGPKAGGGAR